MRPDGSLLTAPGYDTVTQLWYKPASGLELPSIPERPSKAEAEEVNEDWVGWGGGRVAGLLKGVGWGGEVIANCSFVCRLVWELGRGRVWCCFDSGWWAGCGRSGGRGRDERGLGGGGIGDVDLV